eukprot:maker-scaffold_1-snap-gene-25.4-mRNA-1 protein AED:0.03 eAED:0.04 QI:0/0/0/1/1/1/2/0/303
MAFNTRFKFEEKLGSGAFAVVYMGLDKKENKKVAIKKILNKSSQIGLDWTALREIKLLNECKSEFVLRLVSVFADKKSLNLVLEYCPSDLEKVVRGEIILLEKDIRQCLLMTLKGLKVLHDNWIIHRDIKPENLLISSDKKIKVADFGLGKVFGEPDRKYTDEVVTLPYRSPELLFGATQYSFGVDIWAVGCTLAELMIREIFLPGTSDSDQLGKIFYIFGTPTQQSWPLHDKLSKYVQFSPAKGIDLKRRFPAASDSTIQFLKELMALNPNKRISVEEALNHVYFEGEISGVNELPFDQLLK